MNFIPARYSILSSEALQEFVANRYNLSPEMTCVYWQEAQSGGNDMYLIESSPKRYILRVYLNDTSTSTEIDSQAHLCNDLAEAGISAPRVIPAKDGQFVQTLNAAEGIRYATLSEFIEGISPGSAITEAQSHQYGQTLATFHQYCDLRTEKYPLPQLDNKILLEEPLSELLPFLKHRPQDAQTLTDLVIQLGAKLQTLPTTAPTFGVCHGDPHKSNLLCADQMLTLMDFDCAGYSWRAYDLAVFRWSTGRPQRFGGFEPARAQAIWQAFLEGYQSRYALPDLESVRDFVLVRHIWWLAIDFKKVRLGKIGRSWIDEGLFDFQLGILQELRDLA